jgi:hypothetical protein
MNLIIGYVLRTNYKRITKWLNNKKKTLLNKVYKNLLILR